jgi:hypothetical protein
LAAGGIDGARARLRRDSRHERRVSAELARGEARVLHSQRRTMVAHATPTPRRRARPEIVTDPAQTAKVAGLRYIRDDRPGFARRGRLSHRKARTQRRAREARHIALTSPHNQRPQEWLPPSAAAARRRLPPRALFMTPDRESASASRPDARRDDEEYSPHFEEEQRSRRPRPAAESTGGVMSCALIGVLGASRLRAPQGEVSRASRLVVAFALLTAA